MKIKEFFKNHIPRGVAVMFACALVCLIIKIIAVISAPFADFFNRYVSSIFRAVFAHITSVLPFSLAETVIICALPLAALFFIYCLKVSAKKGTLTKQILRVLAVICFLLSAFVLNFSTGYDASPLEEKLKLEVAAPTEDELYEACAQAAIELFILDREVDAAENGATYMPYTFGEMTDKLNAAYDKLCEEYDFISPLDTGVKRIAFSQPLTYTHLSGFYTFWTGEANVNVAYPDFVIVYTTAHEMAHQRGIAREDEANFIAFLACLASDDAYIRYCGYTNMLEYLAKAMYDADPERYKEQLLPFFPKITTDELSAYSRMFSRYSDNIAADISSAANDAYLKSQGVAEGGKSYGLVVDLAVAYFNRKGVE